MSYGAERPILSKLPDEPVFLACGGLVILAIDPGPSLSGWVLLGDGLPVEFGVYPNLKLLERIGHIYSADVVVEWIESYGMSVGAEVFHTCRWAGRFEEAAGRQDLHAFLLPRRLVKLHHCKSNRAKDANIRQALLDRFGGKDRAVGRKASPGPLYGITSHCWAALALGLAWHDGVRPEGKA